MSSITPEQAHDITMRIRQAMMSVCEYAEQEVFKAELNVGQSTAISRIMLMETFMAAALHKFQSGNKALNEECAREALHENLAEFAMIVNMTERPLCKLLIEVRTKGLENDSEAIAKDIMSKVMQ